MSHNQSKPFSHLKLAVGAAALAGLGAGRLIWGMIPKKLDVARYVDLHRFSGTWFEIARKPVSIERKSFHHITYEYHVVGENKLSTVLRYQTKEGRVIQLSGEAMVKNPPENSQYLVSYAPNMLKNAKKPISGLCVWTMTIKCVWSAIKNAHDSGYFPVSPISILAL